jgi:glycerol-3-phosphate dehydrogenase subunit B
VTDRNVVVVGGGAAGTAAALAAREGGAHVTMVRGRTGATSLGSGALDGMPDAELPTLDLFEFGACHIATSAGTIRAAAGRDRALADLDAMRGPVLVARVSHPAWDGDALAAAFAELDSRGFVARDVGLVLHPEERAMQHAEIAARHDDAARLARAAERIRDALSGGNFGAVLLPPWLGIDRPRARELSDLVGLPCGEVLVPVDGPAGLRFERARDRSLQNANVETISGWISNVSSLDADAIVLATGGLLGGLSYTPATRAPFALGYEAPVTLGRDGRPFVAPGSIFGVAPESLLWPYAPAPAIESVGILVDTTFRAAPNIWACGDALEGRPRTVLAALATGRAAGRAASR